MTLAEQFFSLYAGLPRAHGKFDITKATGSKNKVAGHAMTVHEPLTVEKWEAHLNGTQGLGVIPIQDDAHCWWGAIDIDEYQNFDIVELERKIKLLQLPLIPIRTKSGGAHAVMFCAVPVSAELMRDKLHEFAIALGHPGVEIFPKQVRLASKQDVGNWLNMPYFDHDRTMRYAIRDGKALSAEEFIDYALSMRLVDEDALIEISCLDDTGDDFTDGPPCLQVLATSGAPEGTRNNTLFAMGVYARLKYDDWEPKVDEFNQKYMNPPMPSKEVVTLVKSLSRKDYFYPCKKEPLCNMCSKGVCRTRKYGIGDGADDEVSLTIGRMAMIETDPPIWIIEVEGVRMEFDTHEILNQEKFRVQCMNKIQKLPNKVKPHVWEALIRERLADVEKIPAPPDASVQGSLLDLVEHFCTGLSQARVKDEILAGKPWTDDGITYFRSADLMKFLDNQHFRGMDKREVWRDLLKYGVCIRQVWLKGKNVWCWALPEFQVQDSEFDVPRVDDNIPF